MVNIRTKGASAEREICDMMNGIIYTVLKSFDFPEEEARKAFGSVQRNQNQTAVGGNDLTNTMGLSIEVKRQEQLSINTWWKQCSAAAVRNGEHPVLLYRQSRQKWKCVTMVQVPMPGGAAPFWVRAEFGEEDFREWFRNWVSNYIRQGGQVRT